jgi:hypothetical protein
MGMYCASTWALEGFCDSLAYEIAPFNIKLTIVQPNMEVNLLTNRITFAPPLPQYASNANPAPSLRDMLSSTIPKSVFTDNKENVVSAYPPLSCAGKAALVKETIFALTAIGGHENPPARHIVGYEGVASVKEKLKTVSEELEDFVEVSAAVDIVEGDTNQLESR